MLGPTFEETNVLFSAYQPKYTIIPLTYLSHLKLSWGPSIIVNIKPSVQNILFYGEGIFFDSVHFQHFSPFLSFSCQIIHLKNVDVYSF